MSAALDRYFEYEFEGVKSIDLENNILRAAYYGDLDQLKSAIDESAASINAADGFSGKTAFMIAASLGNYSIVEYLSKQPTLDPRAKDFLGQDAYDLAWSSGNAEVVRIIHELIYPNSVGDGRETENTPSGP